MPAWQVRIDFDPAFSSTREMGHVEASLSKDAASRLGIEVDTTARAFQNESIHLEVHVAGGGAADCVRGEVWLPVTKVYTPSLGATTATFAEFSEVLWRHGQRVGRLSGVVSVLNGPRVVQLRSGFYTERGIVPLGPIALDGWATDELADAVADAAGPAPRVPTGDAAAAGAAGCAAAAAGVARTLSSDWTDVGAYPARAYSGGVGGMANAKAASLPQFEHPPKGLELPKQVDALLSLVQNLHEVILDLHIDQVRRDFAEIHRPPRSFAPRRARTRYRRARSRGRQATATKRAASHTAESPFLHGVAPPALIPSSLGIGPGVDGGLGAGLGSAPGVPGSCFDGVPRSSSDGVPRAYSSTDSSSDGTHSCCFR